MSTRLTNPKPQSFLANQAYFSYTQYMKKLLIILVLLISGYFLFTLKDSDGLPLLSYSKCDTPLTYRVGTIDPRFNLTDDETLTTIQEATALWNNAWTKPIFSYDPKGEIVISLYYDERQMLSSQINQIQTALDTDKNAHIFLWDTQQNPRFRYSKVNSSGNIFIDKYFSV